LHRSKRLAIEGLLLGGFEIWPFMCQVIGLFKLTSKMYVRHTCAKK
jgi:hypothetical protein